MWEDSSLFLSWLEGVWVRMAEIGFDFYQHKCIAGGDVSSKEAAYLPVFLPLVNSWFSREVSEFALLLLVWQRVYVPEKNPDSSLHDILKGVFWALCWFCKENWQLLLVVHVATKCWIKTWLWYNHTFLKHRQYVLACISCSSLPLLGQCGERLSAALPDPCIRICASSLGIFITAGNFWIATVWFLCIIFCVISLFMQSYF